MSTTASIWVDADKTRPTAVYWLPGDSAWGKIVLNREGHVQLPTPPWMREVVAQNQAVGPRGLVPVRLTIPSSAKRFTVAINDAAGRRVRNLAGDLSPEDFTVEKTPQGRVVQVMWDCLDDREKLVEAGQYQVIGLAHGGLDAIYEGSFYCPGTPPWPTRDGRGEWGADHSSPRLVARAGNMITLGWPGAEGGCGLVGVGPDGHKAWGEKRGADAMAADESYLHFFVSASMHGKPGIYRISTKDGSFQPYKRDGQEYFPIDLDKIFGDKVPGTVNGMAVHGGKLVLAMSEDKLAVLDPGSAVLLKLLDAAKPTGLAFTSDGKLLAILDGKINQVDLESGQTKAIDTPGVVTPTAIAVDNDGNILVTDMGPDRQVKAYTPASKLVYTCGKQGGRPIRGDFDPQTLADMSSVAVDARGSVWVVEYHPVLRRISVWGRDGKLVRDYIGNTAYGGGGAFLHDQDPTLAYFGPVEMKLDLANHSWKVTRMLWQPDPTQNEGFPVSAHTNILPQRFTSDISGQKHEYMYVHDGAQVVYMERSGQWQPVAAVCLVGQISGRINRQGNAEVQPSDQFAGLNAFDGCFWNDGNTDGRIQRDECEIISTQPSPRAGARGAAALSLTNGWGGRIGSDLAFYANGIVRYRPIGFTDDGAPMYGSKGMEKLDLPENGDLVPLPEENLLLCLSFKGYAGPTTGMLGVDAKTGGIRWSYPNPYPGVHGSHNAPMPKPGMLIGPLKICGVAQVNEQVGRVFLMRGNMGEDYILTTDGLFVGAMFRDSRLPSDVPPDVEADLYGKSVMGQSHGGEPFNGWFGRQSDGKIRTVCALTARQAGLVVRIDGLDSIQRVTGSSVSIESPMLLQAEQANAAARAETVKAVGYAMKKVATPPTVDGNPGEWNRVPQVRIERLGSPNRATVRLAYDDQRLYAMFDVDDTSPFLNEGKDFTRLFKTGDSCDIQLCTDPDVAASAKHDKPAAGDLRIVLAKLGDKPAAVLMKPVEPDAARQKKMHYESPVMKYDFDRVEVMADAQVAVKPTSKGYVLEASIPLASLGLRPQPGMVLRGDMGVIWSDAQGSINTMRAYWSSRQTNIVSDLPYESWLYPKTWGQWTFEPAEAK